MAEVMVRKGDGSLEPLDYNKIRHALRKSGASGALCEEVVDALSPLMKDGISTSDIYRMAFGELDEIRPGAAARFGLKNALLRLGPDGHPFETFVGALLKGRGYATQLRQVVDGRCIQHELDVIATRGQLRRQGADQVHDRVQVPQLHTLRVPHTVRALHVGEVHPTCARGTATWTRRGSPRTPSSRAT